MMKQRLHASTRLIIGMFHSSSNTLLIAFCFVVLAYCEYVQLSVSVNPTTINTLATYTFNLNRQFDPVTPKFIASPVPIPLDSTISITFPSDYTTLSATTPSCTNAATATTLSCSVSSNTIIITDYYASTSTLSNSALAITISNVVNPAKATTSGRFHLVIQNTAASTIDESPPITDTVNAPTLTFTSASFASCSVNAGGATVGSTAIYTIAITPNNPIPVNGQIIVVIPQSWTNDPLSSSVISSTPTCTAVSALSSSTSCSWAVDSSQNFITVSNLGSSEISSALSFTLSSPTTPPTVNSPETITIYSQHSDTIRIDSCSPTIANTVTSSFQTSSFTPSTTNVQAAITATLTLTMARTFSNVDTITIAVPSSMASATLTASNFATFTQDNSGSTITLSGFPASPSTITVGNSIIFSLSNLNNPTSTQPQTFTITFLRDGRPYQSGIIPYSATAASISTYSITPASTIVHTTPQATIALTTIRTLPAGSTIAINYPTTISAGDISSTAVASAIVKSTVVSGVTYSVSANTITISGLFSNDTIGTARVTIGTFINPVNVQPSDYPLTISTSSGYAVLTGTVTLTATATTLSSFTITPSSYTVLATSVTYSAAITTNHPFTAISLTLPSDITLGSSYQATCTPNSFSACSLSGTNLTYTGSLPAGSYTLTWGTVTNPSSLKPTSSFVAITLYDGWQVERSQGTVSVAMTETAVFSSFTVTPSSYLNSATISVTLLMTLPTNAPAGQLTVVFPTGLNVNSASCAGCTVLPPSLLYSIPTGTTSLTLNPANIVNIGSFRPVGSFSVSLTSSDSYLSLSSTTTAWTNTVTSSFSTTVTGDNNYRDETNKFRFALSGMSGSQATARVVIDSGFGALTSAPSGFTLLSFYEVETPCSSTSCTFNLTLTNPSSEGTYSFSLTTFTNDSYSVGASSTAGWTFACAGTTCRSCDPSDACLTCYNAVLAPSNYILNTTNSLCVSACTTGHYLLNTTCTPCDSNCSECSGSATTCTACANGYYLYATFSVCIPICPSGLFQNSLNGKCDACLSPCLTCTGTASDNCNTCVINYYFLNNECISNCQITSKYINNAITRQCDACDSNCVTCTSTTSHCLSCNNTAALYLQGSKCVNNCSSNYFLESNLCTLCQSPCKLCQSSSTTCASCYLNSTAPVYFNAYCVDAASCTIGHYLNTTNSSCQACPINCTVCSGATICSSCSSNYYLHSNLCLLSCPNTTYSSTSGSTGVCSPCNNCLTCSSFTACTSCISSQYLYQEVCYSTCPNGSYKDGTNCSDCDTNCPTCHNATYCSSCITSLLLYQGGCISTCSNGTYPNTTAQLCVNCPTTCATCSSSSECQSCATSYSLEDGTTCVLTCSRGVSFNQICYPCGLNCANCNSNTTVCSSCDSGYYLYENNCLNVCPSTTLSLNNITCTLCSSVIQNCTTCTSSTQCTYCAYGQLNNGTCQPCSPGTFSDSSKCTTCPSTCSTCLNQTYCSTCQTGNFMLNNFCLTSCPASLVPNGTVCSECTPLCSICNQTSFRCSVCSAPNYLLNGTCYSTCPTPYVISLDVSSCITQEEYFQQYINQARKVYFPFTIGAIILILIGVALKCFLSPEMHLTTALCAVISQVELAAWVVFIVFQYDYWSNYKDTSFNNMLVAVLAVAILGVLNLVHLRCYYKYISGDEEFAKWYRHSTCSHNSLLILATTTTFRAYRFVHSKFLNREELSMVLTGMNRLVPFMLIGFLSVLGCSIVIIIANSLALYNSVSRDQQFFIASDTLVVTGIMIILLLMDLKHPSEYFVDEHEAKNLKKKMYQQEEYRVEAEHQSELDEKMSRQNLIEVSMDEGEMAAPQTASKFGDSTGMKAAKEASSGLQINSRRRGSSRSSIRATISNKEGEEQLDMGGRDGSDTKIALAGQGEKPLEEEIIEDSSQQEEKQVGSKWVAREVDHHGYLIKRDANNRQMKVDENGYEVVVDEQGKHHHYDKDGNEMKLVGGAWMPHDKEGYMLKDGKRYDERGYQVREENGGKVFYDKNGCRVVGSGQDEIHLDQDGNKVVVDEDGRLRRYQEDGMEVVDYKGEKVLQNEKGDYMRKNSEGQWQVYDPQDGFAIVTNPQTGQKQKFNRLGLKVVKDEFGQLHYYDEDGFLVTILPGDQLVRHDENGHRVEKDEEGVFHRYDKDGYELVQDEHGNPYYIDKHGYRVERDLYGRATLYDKEGNRVYIDPETGNHLRYSEEGLLMTEDQNGNPVLMDKRGRIVKNLQDGGFQKYDQTGNKIWLDNQGYEIEEDEDGHPVKYDKIGDKVESEVSLDEDDPDQQFESTLIGVHGGRKHKYRYKAPKQVDQDAQLDKLLAVNQVFTFDDNESQISELKQFHESAEVVNPIVVDHQLEKMMSKERSELVFAQKDENLDLQLIDFPEKGLDEDLPEGQGDDMGGLAAGQDLTDSQLRKEDEEYQQYLQQVEVKNPELAAQLRLKRRQKIEKRGLPSGDINDQNQFDREALFKDLDGKEPDILLLKKRQERRERLAREREKNRGLIEGGGQQRVEIRSVADISVSQRSFQNEGVQPIQARTDYDQVDSINGMEMTLNNKQKRMNRSELSLVNKKGGTQTVYNYNTVQVQIKNGQKIYDSDEEIESLHEEDWQQQMNPMVFSPPKPSNNTNRYSNANTMVQYAEEDREDNDALSDLLHKNSHHPAPVSHPSQRRLELFSGHSPSLQEIEEKLFNEAQDQGVRERKEFKMSGAPNPLVQYAKTIEANKRSLQERMYLDRR